MALSYHLGVDLAFDTLVIQQASKDYATAAEELLTLKNELTALLQDLTSSGWTTKAGEAFKEMVEQDWGTNLEKYCDLLKTLSESLSESAKEYDSLVTNQVDQLRLGL